MPEELRGGDVVAAYRRYYAVEKQGYWVGERWVVSKWTRRDVPWFMLDGEAAMRRCDSVDGETKMRTRR